MHEEAPMALSDTRRLEHAGLASLVMLLVGAAVASVPDESQPLPDSYGRDNSFLGWFLALLAFGVVALVAARRLLNSFALRSTDGRHRWSRAAAVAVIVVALVARLVMPAPLVLTAPLDMPAPQALLLSPALLASLMLLASLALLPSLDLLPSLVLLVSLALLLSLVRLTPAVLDGAADVMLALFLSKRRSIREALCFRSSLQCWSAGLQYAGHVPDSMRCTAGPRTVAPALSATVRAYSSAVSWPPRPPSPAPP
jgi:hypothetical protein